ncbi:MAG: rhomboid family intramembrane serine protease [Phycisphaerae bacterium]|jgi:membrane associated rhomboid family serine protease|nr:rhomboid family intramembrane serine protease [Phycisphaerae bacterium]
MRCVPVVNYALVAANVLLYVMGYHSQTEQSYARLLQGQLVLNPLSPQLYQFFTSIFLHGGLMHLVGNMIFLWVFGNAINDRFGHVGYAAFYLSGGVLAGLGHMMFSNAPVLGASGAISAVTGAYLVLFPLVRLKILLWFYLITVFHISSMYFLLFYFIKDAFMSVGGGGEVAYEAHLSGYIFGIGVATLLLVTKILPRNSFDMLNLIRSAHRRGRYRRMAAQGYDPFNRLGSTGEPGSERWTRPRRVEPVALSSKEIKELELRREISDACKRHDLPAAVVRYVELVSENSGAVLPRQEQLDVANQLMHDQQHADAAGAYELFLKHHGKNERVGEIYLLLGLLYGRYLNQPRRGAEMFQGAIDRLDDPQQVALARCELAKLSEESDGN